MPPHLATRRMLGFCPFIIPTRKMTRRLFVNKCITCGALPMKFYGAAIPATSKYQDPLPVHMLKAMNWTSLAKGRQQFRLQVITPNPTYRPTRLSPVGCNDTHFPIASSTSLSTSSSTLLMDPASFSFINSASILLSLLTRSSWRNNPWRSRTKLNTVEFADVIGRYAAICPLVSLSFELVLETWESILRGR